MKTVFANRHGYSRGYKLHCWCLRLVERASLFIVFVTGPGTQACVFIGKCCSEKRRIDGFIGRRRNGLGLYSDYHDLPSARLCHTVVTQLGEYYEEAEEQEEQKECLFIQ